MLLNLLLMFMNIQHRQNEGTDRSCSRLLYEDVSTPHNYSRSSQALWCDNLRAGRNLKIGLGKTHWKSETPFAHVVVSFDSPCLCHFAVLIGWLIGSVIRGVVVGLLLTIVHGVDYGKIFCAAESASLMVLDLLFTIHLELMPCTGTDISCLCWTVFVLRPCLGTGRMDLVRCFRQEGVYIHKVVFCYTVFMSWGLFWRLLKKWHRTPGVPTAWKFPKNIIQCF